MANLTIIAQSLRPRHASKTHGWKELLTPSDVENVLLVLATSWVFAAATLVCLDKFNLILFTTVVGFVTLLVVSNCALALLAAITLQKPCRRSDRVHPAGRMRHYKGIIFRFRADQSGASAMEYGVLVALIAVVVISGSSLGPSISTFLNTISTNIP